MKDHRKTERVPVKGGMTHTTPPQPAKPAKGKDHKADAKGKGQESEG